MLIAALYVKKNTCRPTSKHQNKAFGLATLRDARYYYINNTYIYVPKALPELFKRLGFLSVLSFIIA